MRFFGLEPIARRENETLSQLLARVTRDLQISRATRTDWGSLYTNVRSDDLARLIEAVSASVRKCSD